MKHKGRDARRIRYGGGGIVPVYVDESKENKGQNEEVSVMSYKKGTTVDLTVPSASGPMSVAYMVITCYPLQKKW